MPQPEDLHKPRVGFAFSTKERTDFSRRSLASIDQASGFDLVWVDGSDSTEARNLPEKVPLAHCRLVEVHRDAKGGPDAAIQLGLRRLLALGYDYCGLIENDVVFEPGWFAALMELYGRGRADGFTVGAATVRNVESRVLEYRRGYTLNWNIGAGMVLFTRAAAEAVLGGYGYVNSWEVYEFYKRHLGYDLRDVWELWQDRPVRGLGMDWKFCINVFKAGMICVGSVPSAASNIDVDFEAAVQSRWVGAAADHTVAPTFRPDSLERGRCPSCQTPSVSLWSTRTWRLPFSQDRFGYAQCKNCGAIFCAPRPTAAQLERFYAECYNFRWFEEHLALKSVQGWHRWRRVQRTLRQLGVKPGHLLDIGCGHGLFLRWAKRSGWEVTGLDYPSLATRHAKSLFGLNVIETELTRAAESGILGGARFDVITLWHCLEHAADPRLLLQSARKLLAAGGKMLIAVPNAASPGMRVRREDWVWCQEPFVHTVHFTPKSLQELAEAVGLQCVALWSRDTWDANLRYDVFQNKWIGRIGRRLERLSRRVGFLFYESARLMCYAVGNSRHWCLGQESAPNVGAELLLLASNPT